MEDILRFEKIGRRFGLIGLVCLILAFSARIYFAGESWIEAALIAVGIVIGAQYFHFKIRTIQLRNLQDPEHNKPVD